MSTYGPIRVNNRQTYIVHTNYIYTCIDEEESGGGFGDGGGGRQQEK